MAFLRRRAMIRSMAFGFSLVFLSATAGIAQNCGPYPNNLTNGQPADATQVMANFNTILNCLNSNVAAPIAAMAAHNVVINGGVDVSQELGTTGATLATGISKYVADMSEAKYQHASAAVTSAQLP